MPAKSKKHGRAAAASTAVIAAIIIATLLIGGGERFTSCAIVDVSGSTVAARPAYLDEFQKFATRAGLDGNGDVYVVLAAGDPGADGTPVLTSVAPDEGSDAPERDVETYVAQAAEGLRQALIDPPVAGGGSALVEAALQCAKVVGPGDRMLLLSDGLQFSDVTGSFSKADLTDAGIRRMLDMLEGEGLRAQLEGVEIFAPLLLAHPGGTGIPAPQQRRIAAFWSAWAVWTGGSLPA
jgi:hypothetical protein